VKLGIPYSVVENHTGNHANAVDLELNLLKKSIDGYLPYISMILRDLKCVFYGEDSSFTIRLRPTISEINMLKLYENGLLAHKAMIDFYAKRYNCSPALFVSEDRRENGPLAVSLARGNMAEEEEEISNSGDNGGGGGGETHGKRKHHGEDDHPMAAKEGKGGPGHHGKYTLSANDRRSHAATKNPLSINTR
jgi:hypothetical protein